MSGERKRAGGTRASDAIPGNSVEPLLSHTARDRMNGSWTADDQIRRTKDKLAQTEKFMEKFNQDTKARQFQGLSPGAGVAALASSAAASSDPTVRAQNVLRNSFSPNRGISARSPHPHAGLGFSHSAAAATAAAVAMPSAGGSNAAVNQFNALVGNANGPAVAEGRNVVADLKSQIDGIQRSMQTYAMAGMKPPTFQAHPSVAMDASGAGAKFGQPRGKASSSAAGAGLAAAATGGDAQVATAVATELSAPNVLAGLQQLQQLLGQTQDIMKVMPSISQQIQALKADDRYSASGATDLPWAQDSAATDEYNEFKDNYWSACWDLAQGVPHWISAYDPVLGQMTISQRTNGTNVVSTTTRAVPFQFECMLFDSTNNRLIVGGSRYVSGSDGNSQNGRGHWQPILVSFIIGDNSAVVVDSTWFSEVKQSMSTITDNWPGNGLTVVDIRINPIDTSLYVLINCMSTNGPSEGTAPSSFSSPAATIVVHILTNGKLDNAFDMLSIPRYYVNGGSGGADESLAQGGNIGATGVRMIYSKAHSALFIALYKHSKGATIAVLSSVNGAILSTNLFDDKITYLRDVLLSDNEDTLYVCGYEMIDMTTKSAQGIVYAFKTDKYPLTSAVKFGQKDKDGKDTGNSGVVPLPYQGKESCFTSSRAHRLLMVGTDLFVFGNAIKGGAADRLGLMIWAMSPITGVFIQEPLVYRDPDFKSGSLSVDSVIYDETSHLITIGGGIRMSAKQLNSMEAWVAQLDLHSSNITSRHLPGTPGLYAQTKAIALVDSRIYNAINMQVNAMMWGRQVCLSSVPAVLPLKNQVL
jgi:hypothetical protein